MMLMSPSAVRHQGGLDRQILLQSGILDCDFITSPFSKEFDIDDFLRLDFLRLLAQSVLCLVLNYRPVGWNRVLIYVPILDRQRRRVIAS